MHFETIKECFGHSTTETTCRMREFLTFSPLLLLWLSLPLQYYNYSKLSRSNKKRDPISPTLSSLRITLFVCLIFYELIKIGWDMWADADFEIESAFVLASYIVALIVHLSCGRSNNSCLVLTFLLLTVTQLIDLIVKLFERTIYELPVPIDSLLVFLQAVLLSVGSSVPEKSTEKSPEENCGFVSRVTLSWLDRLVKSGAKSDLTLDDLYPLISSARSENMYSKWEKQWSKNTIRAEHTGKKPSILSTVFNLNRSGWLGLMGIRAVSDVLAFVNPILLKYLIDFVTDPEAPISTGIAIALSMFAIAELRSFIYNYYLYVLIQISVKVQSSLTNAVFQKAMCLSTAARSRRTIGEIVNLMAIDIERIVIVFPFIHNFWSAPLQVSIAMALLWFTVGAAALGGVLIMVAFIPITYCASAYIKHCQIGQMKIKDLRTKLTNEVLNGIKLIKLYAWEEAVEDKISCLRKEEVHLLTKSALMARVVDAANSAAPFLVAVVTFGTYVSSSEENVLTPQKAFVALALFNQIRQPMRSLAQFINYLVQASVSNNRLKTFLNDEELPRIKYCRAPAGLSILMENVKMNWHGPSAAADLSLMNVSIKEGSLTSLVGAVGSGKSSFLSAALGEMHLVNGRVGVSGTLAYAPQQPWLQNISLRENITFGKKFDIKLYNKVIEACQLLPDFALFPYGDLTDVGENGVTLSGGQKARIGLARAVYQNSDVYLLDDILAAVDAHVGAAIFEKVIGPNGLLSTKTRIFATHGLHYTRMSDNIMVFKDGTIVEQGKFSELSENNGIYSAMLADYFHSQKGQSEREETSTSEEEEDPKILKNTRRRRLISSMSEKGNDKSAFVEEKLTKDELMENGRVKSSVYWSFIQAATLRWSLSFFLLMILHYSLQSTRSIWLSQWSDSAMHKGNDTLTVRERLQVYTALGISEVVVVAVAFMLQTLAARAASLNLHRPLLRTILRTPMQFFDTTPAGRILNRFSRDIDVVDSKLPDSFREFVHFAMQAIMVLILISYCTPLFAFAIIPLAIAYFSILHYFIPTSRQLKRLENVQKSPILSTFAESLQGCISLRSYNRIDHVSEVFMQKVDDFTRCNYLTTAANRWLCLRLELLGNITVMLSALLGVFATRCATISPGLVGLSVSFALTITDQLNLMVRMLSDLETNVVSVERIKEYSNSNEMEMEWHIDCSPDNTWPNKGEIRFENYSTQYRKNLPLVLKSVTATIDAGEKVAVVGRTGSGKSSLTLALFRLIEPTDGSIIIDKVNTCGIGLHDLRAKLAIIPQEPVLFSGSLRFNLDPFGKHTDEELWLALEACQLKEFITSQHNGLGYEIAEGGTNMSIGQRQLVCLGRALLRKGKILILDEATAAVDVATDSLVQEVIRDKFSDATVIAIAHRLNTIANYDRIMVLERGRIAEFDTPQNLLRDENSRYSRMVEKSKTH